MTKDMLLEQARRMNSNSTYGAFGLHPSIKYDTLLLKPKGTIGDKNHCLELTSSDEHRTAVATIELIVRTIAHEPDKFKPLNLFIQGQSKTWILIEAWSNEDDLFFEFCQYVAEQLNLPLE